jgi:hypothetical protein
VVRTRFKELGLDASGDPGVLGRFWAAVTGAAYVENDDPDNPGDVRGTEEGMGVGLGLEPAPRTVKHRVHLDVYARSVQDVLDLGATLAPGYDTDRWTVLLDPEGGELCVFEREDVPTYRAFELVVDAVDPAAITAWWGEVFDVPPRNEGQPWSWLTDVPGMPFDAMLFQPVPEPKSVKNRLHWDVYGDVDELLAAGATLLWELPRWTTLADPEGNEFCVFAPR